MKFIYNKLVSEAVSGSWSEAFEFVPGSSTDLSKRDNLFVVIFASPDGNIEKSVKTNGLMFRPRGITREEIISYFKSEYIGSKKTSNLESLKDSLQRTKDRCLGCFEKFEIAACSFFGKAVYIAASGGSKVILKRDQKAITLIDSTERKTVSASGFFKSGDMLILGTSSFFENISDKDIEKNLDSKNLEAAIDSLNTKLNLVEQNKSSAALFLSVLGEDRGFRFAESSASDVQHSFFSVQSNQISEEQEYFGIKSTKGIESLFKRRLKSESEKESDFERKSIRNWFKKLTGNILSKNIFVRDNTSSYEYSKKKKVSATVGLILIILFAVSVVFGIRQKKISGFKNEYQEKLNQAEHELQEAEEIFLISPERSRELLNSSRLIIGQLKEKGIKDERLTKLSLLLEEKQKSILGEYPANPELFIDLSLLSSGFSGSSLAASNGTIYVLDVQGKKLVKISLDTKRSEVVAGPGQLGEVKEAAAYAERIFILTAQGVSEIDGSAKQIIERYWTGGALICSYAGNIYILDKDKSEIQRFSGLENGFSSGSNWLAEGTSVDLSAAKLWVIDGAIWILEDEGKVLKLSLGNRVNFGIGGIFPEITALDAIYTSEDTQYLYLLDSKGKRVIVVDKDGNYQAQYVSDEIGKAKSLVVSEEEGKIILLTGEKLLSIEITD